MQKKALITGIGGVGGYAGHLLARVSGIELFLSDVRKRYGREKANNIHIDNSCSCFPVWDPGTR